ncbi:MAG: heme ABC transporter ATP-binding protein [Hydrogenovibrio sp.]
MLVTENLNIALQGKPILKHIDLTIEPGSMVSILGPNGAGKSTLMKSLSGDLPDALNQVRLEGRRLDEYRVTELANLRAVMPQSVQLDFPFLVSEVIEMSLLTSVSHADRSAYVDRALAMFDVAHLKDRNYLTLSGGEQQRVQLARVMAQIVDKVDQQNRYLFLDECTSSLDLAHQHQVFEVVESVVKKHRIAAMMVLHDLNLASQYSDRLVLMNQGEIVSQGTVSEVLQAERITDVYGYPVQIIPHPNGWPMVIPA